MSPRLLASRSRSRIQLVAARAVTSQQIVFVPVASHAFKIAAAAAQRPLLMSLRKRATPM